MENDYTEQIPKIIEIIRQTADPDKIYLFGSYANGNQTPDSDVDILVVKESDLPRRQRGREIRKSLRHIPVALDLLVYTPNEIEEWQNVRTAFITQVIKTGKLLYERN